MWLWRRIWREALHLLTVCVLLQIDAVLSCVNADIQEQKKSFEQKCAMQHSLGITEVKPFSSHHTIYVFGAYGIGMYSW